ncbi:MAG: glycosyltransferase family 2 protein [Pseudomonadota bacterium]
MAKAKQVLLTTCLDHPHSAFVEWVAHHRALGVSRVHVFMSDAKDSLPPLATALIDAGAIEVSQIACDPAEASGQIRNAATRAAKLEASEKGGWGLFLGADEYLILSQHDTLAKAMASMTGAHVVSLPLRLVGTDGLIRSHMHGPVLARCHHRCPDPAADGSGARDWRSVVKLGVWPRRVPGRPTGDPQTGLKRVAWFNGSGARMPKPHSAHIWQREASSYGADVMSVAHVPVPSVETMLLRAGYFDRRKAQMMAEDVIPTLDRLSGAMIADPVFARSATARDAELVRLMEVAGIRDAYALQCEDEEMRVRVQARKHPLWKAVFTHLGYVDATEPALADSEKDATPERTSPPEDAAVEPASPTDATPPVAPDAGTVAPVKLHAPVTDDLTPITTDPPPPWFTEIYPGGERQGFLTRLEHHALVHVERDPSTLVVTFDNLSNVNDLSLAREPWAYDFVKDGGYSHLSVMARRKDWYRDPELIAALQKLSDDGHFRRYKNVVMAGTSMGAFGALAFSSLAPGCTVLAYSPQSTLDTDLVPWETRYRMGRDRNWSLPHSDAAFEIQDAGKVYLIYDPFFEPDKKHVERLSGDNVVALKSWFSGHFSAVFLRRAHIIKPVFQSVIDGSLEPEQFYELMRKRRSLIWYRKAIEERAVSTGHPALAARIGPAFKELRRARRTAEMV